MEKGYPCQPMTLEPLDIRVIKNEPQPPPPILYKNELTVDHKSKCAMERPAATTSMSHDPAPLSNDPEAVR